MTLYLINNNYYNDASHRKTRYYRYLPSIITQKRWIHPQEKKIKEFSKPKSSDLY